MFVFNDSGLLVPDAMITSTLLQLEDEFVTKIPTIRRKEIFNAYLKYNNHLKKVCKLEKLHQWVNGSYISKKANPGDIDFVTFIDHEIVKKTNAQLNNFRFPNSEKIYNVDAYVVEVYSEDHKDIFKYYSDYAYWYDRFTKTRRVNGSKIPKGFLEIFI